MRKSAIIPPRTTDFRGIWMSIQIFSTMFLYLLVEAYIYSAVTYCGLGSLGGVHFWIQFIPFPLTAIVVINLLWLLYWISTIFNLSRSDELLTSLVVSLSPPPIRCPVKSGKSQGERSRCWQTWSIRTLSSIKSPSKVRRALCKLLKSAKTLRNFGLFTCKELFCVCIFRKKNVLFCCLIDMLVSISLILG